jgi:hypothetical protein
MGIHLSRATNNGSCAKQFFFSLTGGRLSLVAFKLWQSSLLLLPQSNHHDEHLDVCGDQRGLVLLYRFGTFRFD